MIHHLCSVLNKMSWKMWCLETCFIFVCYLVWRDRAACFISRYTNHDLVMYQTVKSWASGEIHQSACYRPKCQVLLATHQSVKFWASANTPRPCCTSRHLKPSRRSETSLLTSLLHRNVILRKTSSRHRDMKCSLFWRGSTHDAIPSTHTFYSLHHTFNTLHQTLRVTNETISCILI